MTFPVTIIDNFFEAPDKIVELSKQYSYEKTDASWPGCRTDIFYIINPDLNEYIANRLGKLFFLDKVSDWRLYAGFQKCPARHKNQSHPKNRGWVHHDEIPQFGGVIYLDKNPVKDTGTSIYRLKDGYHVNSDQQANSIKRDHHQGKDIPDDVYIKHFNRINDKFVETIRVENVYNRMLLFSNQTFHAAQTYGTMETEDRLTIAFFGSFQSFDAQHPLLRMM